MNRITKEELLAQRFFNQGLIQPYSDLTALLKTSLGIQSQYLNHALFNIANRLALTKKERVEEGIEAAILGWGQRQTYHFYDFDTWQDISHFLKGQSLWATKYFQTEYLDIEKESQELKSYLAKPQTRKALSDIYGERWAKLFLWSALFVYHSCQGKLYQKWLPNDRLIVWNEVVKEVPPHLSRKMLEAYFTFYGPATIADAAYFFGVKQTSLDQRDIKHLKAYEYDGRIYYAKHWQKEVEMPEVLVLGKFDPLLVAYKYKEVLIEKEKYSLVWKKAGQISALILIKGKLRGTWTFSINGGTIAYTVNSQKKISQKHQASIRRIFKQYAKWMGKTIKKIEFIEENKT